MRWLQSKGLSKYMANKIKELKQTTAILAYIRFNRDAIFTGCLQIFKFSLSLKTHIGLKITNS